jgi:hypothetical protein
VLPERLLQMVEEEQRKRNLPDLQQTIRFILADYFRDKYQRQVRQKLGK